MADYAPDPDPLPVPPERADGEDGRIGDATPAGALTIDSPDGLNTGITINEREDSPTLERAEQATFTRKLNMSWAEALTRIQYYGRGTPLVDLDGNNSVVISATIQHLKGEAATLETVSVSTDYDPPPDKLEIVPVELGINILKYPRYFYAFNPTADQDDDYEDNIVRNQSVIRWLQNYFENPTPQYREALITQLYFSKGLPGTVSGQIALPNSDLYIDTTDNSNVSGPGPDIITVTPTPGTDFAKAAAMEIAQKYWKNEETPYIVGYQLTWTSFYFLPQMLNPGGYTENPITESTPQLPDYLTNPDPDGTLDLPSDIFQWLAEYNPQCFSADGTPDGGVVLSCLRKADQQEYNLPLYKVDRTWLIAALGFWDAEFYNKQNRPAGAADYLPITPPKITSKTWSDANISSV
jgi:hypothetical protein